LRSVIAPFTGNLATGRTINLSEGTATTIQGLFRGYANQRAIYSNMLTVDDRMDICFHEEIITGLKLEKLTTAKRDEYLRWAEKIGKKRIDHIVSN